jgi:hypothetical protein
MHSRISPGLSLAAAQSRVASNWPDVSWSNIRVEAFPGMEWSRTPREALKFMSSRVWPSREARSELRRAPPKSRAQTRFPGTVSHRAHSALGVFEAPASADNASVRAALDQCRDEPDIRTSR